MRILLSLALIGFFTSFSAQETLTYPYNPDGNEDGIIASPDLLNILGVYGNAFTPAQIMVTQCLYTGWCIPIVAAPNSPAIEVFNEPLPEGYQYLENQSCAASIILNDTYCVYNSWDVTCENAYSLCVSNSSCEMGLSAYLSSVENRMTQMEEFTGQLQASILALQTENSEQAALISELQSPNGGIAGLENYLSVDESTNTVLITGANLQVVSGGGSTNSAVNGTGNIIVGYNEGAGNDKSGSHNLVVGAFHTYSSYGGLIMGYNNSITGTYSSVSGGQNNTASGHFSSVSGGRFNNASGSESSVSGGWGNIAGGPSSSVLGGFTNVASGNFSSVSGGENNDAWEFYSTASGQNDINN